MTQPGLEPTIYCTQGEHANHYATDVNLSVLPQHLSITNTNVGPRRLCLDRCHCRLPYNVKNLPETFQTRPLLFVLRFRSNDNPLYQPKSLLLIHLSPSSYQTGKIKIKYQPKTLLLIHLLPSSYQTGKIKIRYQPKSFLLIHISHSSYQTGKIKIKYQHKTLLLIHLLPSSYQSRKMKVKYQPKSFLLIHLSPSSYQTVKINIKYKP